MGESAEDTPVITADDAITGDEAIPDLQRALDTEVSFIKQRSCGLTYIPYSYPHGYWIYHKSYMYICNPHLFLRLAVWFLWIKLELKSLLLLYL